LEYRCKEADVRDHRSFDAVTAPNGSSPSKANASNVTPADDDAGLLALEMQFNRIVAELRAAQGLKTWPEAGSEPEAGDHEIEVESILARLYPVEQRIMQTPARTIEGLAVKARHAAYVMSQYWEAPIDRIDWHARAVRLLIEAVCHVAHAPLLKRDDVSGVQP
jgi:hypothetical protein